MKKELRILSIVAALLLVAGFAFGANGDTLNIGGQVPLILTLTVTANAAADNLTLVGATLAFNPTIAAIDIATNNTAGWELWVFSASSAGLDTGMFNADGDEIVYSITYAGTGGAAAAAIPPAGVLIGENAASTGDTAAVLSVTYDQSITYPAGYYSDQLSLVLRAK
jgi:hypothetical protein